jgi:hypothetical protein
LEVPASTRALALGDAYMMDARHADAVFYHPALLADASGFGVEVQTWSPSASSASAAAGTPWLGGGIAVGLQAMQYGLAGPEGPPAGQDHLFDSGGTPVSERVVSVGYGRSVYGIQLGAVGKLAEERVGTVRDAFALVDLGMATDLGPLRVGLTYQGLGTSAEEDLGERDRPGRLTLAAGGYGQPVGIFDLGLTGAITRRTDGELLAGAGLEVGYWPINGRTFVGRIGVRNVPDGAGSPLSVGFAYWGDSVMLEWAYRAFGGDLDEGTHRFGVRWR